MPTAYNQIVNELATIHWRTDGANFGAGRRHDYTAESYRHRTGTYPRSDT